MSKNVLTRLLALCLVLILSLNLMAPVLAADDEPSVTDYESFLAELKVLEQYADDFAVANPSYKAGELVLNFIRTGVERYNDGNWVTLAGQEVTQFTTYVQNQDLINGTNVMALRNIVIDNFRLPNGNLVDFGHMFGTMNISYLTAVATDDLAGWAGDLCDLLLYAYYYGNVPAGSVEEMSAYILDNCFGVNADDAFGMDDFYGDMDAYYLIHQWQSKGGSLSSIMESYFTSGLSDADRAAYFLNNRFKNLNNQEDVRSAILGSYTANTGLKVLESDRGLSGLTDLRMACCYAFADYLFEQAGDRLEGGSGEEEEESDYYKIFSSTESILAPGITQVINYATTADNKQIVYYVATVDVTRDDVTIMANYKDNNPGGGWGMQRVEDQANALLNNYKGTNENFNVIVATNADGYNMSTGKPGGLLVMDGVEWHPVDGDGFFAILKDGSAMIGTKEEYATYKNEIKEAVGAFGATLVKDGKMAVNKNSSYYSSRASRTAIGITADGKVVMMVLDGRQEPFSAGGSMEEIAQIMLDAGCVEAVNLDGGGSTTYLSKPEGSDKLQLVNRPSDGYARSVATSLVAVSTARSSKEFDHANITSEFDYLTIGTSLVMKAEGVSNTGNSAALPEGYQWAVSDDAVGTITPDGVFTAVDNGTVEVQLVVDGTVVGSKVLNVVIPDTLSFTQTSMNIIYGVPALLPLQASYNGNLVAINSDDVYATSMEYEEGIVIDGFYIIADESIGIRNSEIGAILNYNEDAVCFMKVSVYRADEAFFDFDNATAGNRTLAWLREVNNAESADDMLYHIVDTKEDMGVSYSFALDMTQIEIPAQLADLTYMLPGADTNATAWSFLLYLAERVSVLTEVRISAQLDANVEVDISNLKVSNDYFYLKDANLDDNNMLTVVFGWVDQTTAIDAATANPICILSGIDLKPKDGASWDDADQLIIKNSGSVSYDIYLRANALYSFAKDVNNQKQYGLYPFENKDVIIGGATEKGAHFGSVYADFEDTFVLDRTNRQGWYEIDNQLFYYVDNEPVTGLQYLPSVDDGVGKLYYQFDANGVCVGTYTGLIHEDGKVMYAMQGKLQIGWQSIMEEDGQSYFYYFHPYDHAAVGAGEGWIDVEGYQYLFKDYKCTLGQIVATSGGLKYRFAGLWQRNQWIEIDGKAYFIARDYYITTGNKGGSFKWIRTFSGETEGYHLIDENGVWMRDFTGIFHIGEDSYYVENGIRIQEPGLMFIDGYYYYFAANAKAVKNRTYWPTKTNGLLPVGPYKFDEQGRITNPPSSEPDIPGTPDTPVTPVKDGLVQENGGYFYYKNGVLQYCAGLIIIDGDYYYIRSNGQAAVGNYWITNHNGLKPQGQYTFGADGKLVVDGGSQEPDIPDTPDVPEVKDGLVNENGVIYYYVNGTRGYCAGLVLIDGAYYYIRTNAQVAVGEYWITNTNGHMNQGKYYFDAEGKMVNAPSVEPDQPENPEVKDGIVAENGGLYFYQNGKLANCAGLVKLVDEQGNTFYIYVRTSGKLATGKYWPTNTNDLLPIREYDFGTDGRLYL